SPFCRKPIVRQTNVFVSGRPRPRLWSGARVKIELAEPLQYPRRRQPHDGIGVVALVAAHAGLLRHHATLTISTSPPVTSAAPGTFLLAASRSMIAFLSGLR